MMEDVSVIIPAYNAAATIARAVAGVRRQSLAPREIVVVDDASTDETSAVVAAIADPRLRRLAHAHNRGAASARNTGVAAATGAWVAFLDSDDEWADTKLEAQLGALSRAGTAILAGVTGFLIRDERTGEVREVRPGDNDVTADGLVWGCFCSPGSTLIVRREAFEEIGPFDAELRRLEDWDWLMRYTRRHPLGLMPDALTTVHKSSDPNPAHVADAVARLRLKHRDAWYRRGWLAGRKFDSTLHVEAAAGAYYAGAHGRMLGLLLRAVAAYPARRGGFFAMLGRRAVGALQAPLRHGHAGAAGSP
jgi:glycosyltransferase involved in cell wall biosynthesis